MTKRIISKALFYKTLFLLALLPFYSNTNGQSHIRLNRNGVSIMIYQGQKFNYLNSSAKNRMVKRDELQSITADSLLVFKNDTINFQDFVYVNRSQIFSAELYKKPFILGSICLGTGITLAYYMAETYNYGKSSKYYQSHFSELFQDYNHTIISAAATGAFWTYFYLRNKTTNSKLRSEWDYELIIENDE